MFPKPTVLSMVIIAAVLTAVRATESSDVTEIGKPPVLNMEVDGTTHVPAFDLPLSGALSKETRAVLLKDGFGFRPYIQACPGDRNAKASVSSLLADRKCWDDNFWKPMLKRMRARYAVNIEPRDISGAKAFVITPRAGIAPENRSRVLIHLSAGAFVFHTATSAQLAATGVSSVGGIKVVGIDFRKAPEYRHPAAVEDVAAVYQELLKEYKPESIGIFGCSSGGQLTSQTVPWFKKQGLPLPGALVMGGMGGRCGILPG